jgi:O-antigen/teichoic acid export membrane protein
LDNRDIPTIKDLFKDMAKYLPSMVIPAIVGIAAIPVITRLFLPGDYGNYVLVVTTVLVLSAIATAWIRASIIRFFPAYSQSNRLEELYSTVIKLAFTSVGIVSILFLGVCFLIRDYISAKLYSLMLIGEFVFVATSCYGVFLDILRAKRQVNWYSSLTIWHSIAGLGAGVALVIIFHYGVEGLLWGSFLSMTLALPLLRKLAMRKPSFKESTFHSPMTKEIAKFGFPVLVINLATWILSLSDRYMLKFFQGSQEVGLYSVSYAISEHSLFMIASLFMLASAPIGYHIWEGKEIAASRNFLNKLTRYYLLVGLPVAVGLSLLAKPVVSVLTVPAYYAGHRIIPMVAFGAFLVGVEHRFAVVLGYYKRSDLGMYCILISGLLNIGLNLLFIPIYGYMAAAATTFVSYAFMLLLVVLVSRKFMVWTFPFKSTVKIVCASAVMGIVVYYIGNGLTTYTLLNLLLAMLVGAVVYGVMLLLLREPQKEEIQELQELKNRILMKIKQLITNGK